MSTAVRARRPHPGVRIVFDGTSLNNVPGDGYGGFTDPRRSFPFCAMTGTKTPFRVVAENANSWGSLAVTAATRLYPYGGKADNTVLVLNGGSLSFWDGLTGQQTYDAMVSYADNARANGFDFIIASTHTPYDLSAQGHPTGGEETARLAYNALIMANAAGDFDAVYDMAADPLDDPQDTSIYFDKAHFSIAGAHDAGERTFNFLTGLTLGVIPTSIAYDGTEDVTTAVNDWITSMVPGTTNLTFQPGGIYLINDGPIVVPSGVTINFNGATLLRNQILDVSLRHSNITPYISLNNVDDVTVRDGIISGLNINNGDLNALAESSALATAINGGRIVTDASITNGDATLTSPTAVFTTGDVGVHVTGTGIPSGTSIISRTNATTVELSRNATATITGTATVNINVIYYLWDTGGVSELQALNYPSGEVLGDYGVYCPALAFEMGIDARNCDGVTITNWDMTGVFGDYVNNQLNDNVTITNVTGRRNGRQGIAINGGNNITISGCDIRSTRSGIDIEPTSGRSTTNVEISDCILDTHLGSFANNGHGPCDNIRFLRNTMPSGAGFMWQCIAGRDTTNHPPQTYGVSITNGSPTIISTPPGTANFTQSAYGSSVGQPIYGPGIPLGATVIARQMNSLTMSTNATATATGQVIRIGTGLRSNYEIRDNVGTYEMSGPSNAYIMLEAMNGCVIDNNDSVTDPSDNRSGVMFMYRRSTDIDVTGNWFAGCDDAVEDVIGDSDWTESDNDLTP